MKFKALQENLRREIWARIEAGELTGLRLAGQAGFRQAHISNFLNRKRGLSLEAMDKVLTVRHLSILDLLDPEEINQRATVPPISDDEFENVPLVDGSVAAAAPHIMNMRIREFVKFKKSFVRRLRSETGKGRQDWQRFVAIKVDAREGMSMYPRLLPGATVLIDRHYNSLKSYRRNELNMYAVAAPKACKVKYVELAGDNLILRPHNQDYPVEVITLEKGKPVSDYLIGRVCHVGIET
jgi:hypothetical protein